MIDIEIATTWNVETLAYVFNAVAAMMAGDDFAGLLRMVFMFALMVGIFAYLGSRQLEMAQWLIQALVFVTLLMLPVARVSITDRAGLEPPQVVSHVPFALAVVGQTTNLIGGWMSRRYEAIFGVPDELGLQQGDLAFGHRILRNTNRAVIRDPELRADLLQFIKECTLYDVKDGAITAQQIVGETDTWNTIFNNSSPARYVTYHTLSAMPSTRPCTEAATYLRGRVEEGVEGAMTFYGRRNFTRSESDAAAGAMFAAAIGTSYDWIIASSSSASDAMKQAMFNNLWREAGAELPALMSDTARIQELQTLQASAQAARQGDGANATVATLAQETLPHLRNWLEAILYGIFPLVVVLVVVAPADGVKRLIGGYMLALGWIALWPLLFALINHLSLMLLRHKLAALKLADGVPFQLADVFDATLGDEQAAVGYMVILVPFIAAGIMRLAQGGFMSMADKFSASFSGAASAAGAGLMAGNASMGQVGVDTVSANSTSMHKYDSNMGLFSGGAAFSYGSGDTATLAANGAQSLSQFQNKLLSSMAQSHQLQSERALEAHDSRISSIGEQHSDRHADASTFTKVIGADRTRGNFQNKALNVEHSRSGQQSGSHSSGHDLGHQLGDRSHFSTVIGANDSIFVGGSANVAFGKEPARSIGAGGVSGTPGSAGRGQIDPVDAKRISSGLKNGGANQRQIDDALVNYRSGNYPSAQGKFVTDDFGNSVRVPGPDNLNNVRQNSSKKPDPPSAEVAPRKSAGTGVLLGGSLGAQSQKTYVAQHGKERTDAHQHGESESARLETGFSVGSRRSLNQGSGEQSMQGSRSASDAARTDVDEFSRVRDVSDRSEAGVGRRSSRTESDSFSVHRDLLADPALLEKAAVRNSMSAVRFMGQARGQMFKMVREYVAERKVARDAMTLQPTALDGKRLSVTEEEVKMRSELARRGLLRDIDALHEKKKTRVGFGGVDAVNVELSAPPILEDAEQTVRNQLDARKPGSIPSRARELDENVSAWASHDKAPGDGRANPMAVVEDAERRDMSDSVKKLWDMVTGGDGTADGSKLNENVRRESGSRLDIRGPAKDD